MRQHSLDDAPDLLDGFAAPKDHFRKTLSQRAMMVDSGKAHIFEGQVLQLLQTVVYRESALFHPRQYFLDVLFRHGRSLLMAAVSCGFQAVGDRSFWRLSRKLVQ